MTRIEELILKGVAGLSQDEREELAALLLQEPEPSEIPDKDPVGFRIT